MRPEKKQLPPVQNNAALNRALQQIYKAGGPASACDLESPVCLHLVFCQAAELQGRNAQGFPSTRTVSGYVKAELIGSPNPKRNREGGGQRLLTVRLEDGFVISTSPMRLMSWLNQREVAGDGHAH